MKNYQEKREEAEGFITEKINQHLESIESSFDSIGLEETFEEYSDKLSEPDFGTSINGEGEELIEAIVDGSVILSVKLEKNYLGEFSVYENNL